jgi:hypothetical protein
LRQPPPAEGHAVEQERDLEQEEAENRSERAVGCTLCSAAPFEYY